MNIVLNPPNKSHRDRMGEEVGKIFVGAVSRETTIDAFRAYFESFGNISDIVLMMDKDTRTSKGYGFVKYEDPRCAEDVLAKKGHHMLDGRALDTKACNARGSRPRGGGMGGGGGGGHDDQRTKKVFVGGISQQATKDDLYELFKQFGMVEDVHIMTDTETGKHRGFGFVTLDSEEAVDKLVRMQHLELKGKSMEIKKAQPKQNRGFGGQGGPGQMGAGGFGQGGQLGYGGGGGSGGYGGANQWNMSPSMSQYGQQQQGGFPQRGGGGGQGYGGQQQGYSNGYRQQGQAAAYGQQGGYGQQQQQQQQQPQQQQSYGGKPNADGDKYGGKSSSNGGQSYGGYAGYGQAQQDPYGQQQQQPQQQQQQQYGSQGSMGSYAQEASGYGPQRVNYNQQQGYNQGQFGSNMPGQNYGPPQQQQQPPQPPQQHQPQQGYEQHVEGGPDNYGRGNMGGGNQFHPYRRFQGNQVQ